MFINVTKMAEEYIFFSFTLLKKKYKNVVIIKTAKENKILACHSVKKICKLTVTSVFYIFHAVSIPVQQFIASFDFDHKGKKFSQTRYCGVRKIEGELQKRS